MKEEFPLAVISPYLGNRSETFIRRHVTDILPGETVLIYQNPAQKEYFDWDFEGPRLGLSEPPRKSLFRRLWRGFKLLNGHSLQPYSYETVGEFLRRHHVQVILCEYLHFSLRFIDIARKEKVRIYAHAHGYDVSTLLNERKWVEAYRRLNEVDGIITMNKYCEKRLIDIGIEKSIINFVPYGVDISDKGKVHRPKKIVKCLAVGRMVAKKSPIYLLESFRRALQRFPEMELDVIGDGLLMPAAMHFVESFGLKNSIRLHGSRANSVVQDFMSDADIFVQHSVRDAISGDEEGMPVAILEAMAKGIPVVSTWHAGIPEVVEEGETGFLVGEGKVDLMADRIFHLATNLELRKEMGLRGWQRIKEQHTWDLERTMLRNILEI